MIFTPKQQDSSSLTPPLHRSVQTHGFLTRRQLNSIDPCPFLRVVSTSPRVDPSINLSLPLLNTVTHPITGAQYEYRHFSTGKVPGQCPLIWKRAFANELGRLSQGIRDIKGINTNVFLPFEDIPMHKTPTYSRIVSDIKPHKQEVERIQLTVGGDRIICHYDSSTPVANLTIVKIHFNIIISTPKAKFLGADIRNLYLNNDLP